MLVSSITDAIVKKTGNENVIVMKLDLSSLRSVRVFAKDFLQTETRLDILIHNAGYAGVFKKAKSVDGILVLKRSTIT